MENKPNGCCISDLVHVYENLDLFYIHSINQCWKDMENGHNGPGKSWKTHIKRSWKVMENQFQHSVRTLDLIHIISLSSVLSAFV